MPLDLTAFTPIADVMLLEKRQCRKCHFWSFHPAGVMRLWTSHSGPHRHCVVPRKEGEAPLTIHGTREVETHVDACLRCWHSTATWEELKAIVPEAPPTHHTPAPDTHLSALARMNAKGVDKEAKARMAKTMSGSTPRPTLSLATLLQRLGG